MCTIKTRFKDLYKLNTKDKTNVHQILWLKAVDGNNAIKIIIITFKNLKDL